MTKLEKIFLGLSVTGAFLFRLYILLNTKLTFGSTDDAIYASLARFFSEGNLSQAFHPTWSPLFPISTAFVNIVANSWERSAQIVSALSGSVLTVPLYFLAKKFLPKTLALLVALTSPLMLVVFNASLLPLSDMLATLFLISAITYVVYALDDFNKKHFYASAVFFGLTYLTRSEGFMFFGLTCVFIFSYLCFTSIRLKKLQSTNFLLLPIMAVIFLLTISPYWIATKNQTGNWSLSQKAAAQIKQGHSFQLKNGTTWSQEIVSIKSPNYKSAYFQDGLSHVLEYSDWFGFWFLQKANVWKDLFLTHFPALALIPMVIGIASLFFSRYNFSKISYLLYLSIIVIPITIFATPLTDPRYLLWVFPIVLLFIYVGIQRLCQLVVKANLVFPLIGCLIVTISLPAFDGVVLRPKTYADSYTNTYYHPEIENTGTWLKTNTQNPIVMMKHEGIEFYSNSKTLYLPQDTSLEKTVEYGKKHGATHIIALDSEVLADGYLSELLNQEFKSPLLERVYMYPETTAKIIVYEIK